MTKKVVGILGGMGPEATADIYLKMVRIFQEGYGAIFDSDYPTIIIYSLPIPDVVKGLEDRDLAKTMLISAAKKLEYDGADFIILACNTISVFLPEIRSSVSIPVIDIAEEVRKFIGNRYKIVGLLSTASTAEFDVFDKELKNSGIRIVKLDKTFQKALTGIILDILGGNKSEDDIKKIDGMFKYLSSCGAEAVILGCTDLPLLINKSYIENIEVIDTNLILAMTAVEESMRGFKTKER